MHPLLVFFCFAFSKMGQNFSWGCVTPWPSLSRGTLQTVPSAYAMDTRSKLLSASSFVFSMRIAKPSMGASMISPISSAHSPERAHEWRAGVVGGGVPPPCKGEGAHVSQRNFSKENYPKRCKIFSSNVEPSMSAPDSR